MASSGPLRVVVAITSIGVALVAAFYASLLPELPVPSQVSKVAAALSGLKSKVQLSTSNVIMASRAPVYFFSHGGVCHQIPYFRPEILKRTSKISQM